MTEMDNMIQSANRIIADCFSCGTGMINQSERKIVELKMDKAREYIDRMKKCANRNKEGSKNDGYTNTNSEI